MTSSQQDTATASGTATATFQTLASFAGTDGANPYANLVIDAAGNLYGTTEAGGTGKGTLFEIAKTATGFSSTPTTLVTYHGRNGNDPGNLIIDGSGNLFGTTALGGANERGTVFELHHTANGYAAEPKLLLSFRKYGGFGPEELTTDKHGDLIGITGFGPTPSGTRGTVFELAKTAHGYRARQTVLTSFKGVGTSEPSSNLATDSSGDLFGSTSFGGPSGQGEIYELVKKAGGGYQATPKILSTTSAVSLVTDQAGDIFGTSRTSGGDGSVFELTKTATGYSKTPLTLAAFDGPDGSDPRSLVMDQAGNLYGTTYQGGADGKGTVFEIAKTATGYATTPTTLVSFDGTNGASPVGDLRFDAAGHLYGTTYGGGANNDGTVFEIDLPAPVVCFAAGTRIHAVAGHVAVETLAVGDLVVTASGEARPIRWLGHRTIDCSRHPRRREVMPVRIAAHAFGPDQPMRDLMVSPGHAICVDALGEMLVPAAALVNGATVRQVEADTVTYWHVELDSHDLLLAEGMPCESYLEMGNRGFFAESGLVMLDASPDATATRTHADFCRPFHASGPLVDAVRAVLDARCNGRQLDGCPAAFIEAVGPCDDRAVKQRRAS